MIHFEVVGDATAVTIPVFDSPYDAATASENTQLAITAAPPPTTTVFATAALPPFADAWFILRNVSTGLQQIRIGVGSSPSFSAPIGGVLLYPGESLEGKSAIALTAVADVAGALLDRLILRRP